MRNSGNKQLGAFTRSGIHYPNQTARQGHSNKLQPIDALCELTAPAHGQSGRPSLASGRALTGSSPPPVPLEHAVQPIRRPAGKAPRKPQRAAVPRPIVSSATRCARKPRRQSAHPTRGRETSSARPHGVPIGTQVGRAQPERVVHAHGPQEAQHPPMPKPTKHRAHPRFNLKRPGRQPIVAARGPANVEADGRKEFFV